MWINVDHQSLHLQADEGQDIGWTHGHGHTERLEFEDKEEHYHQNRL